MQKRTREILALVLLAALAVVAVAAMGYYILVGHNWNVTASNIDDSIGQMDGYVVVLYEGTTPADIADERDGSNEAAGDKAESGFASPDGRSVISSSTGQQSGVSEKAAVEEKAPLQSEEEAASSESEDAEAQPITLAGVAESYREKGAAVFTVDLNNLGFYNEPFVVAKDHKRIGLFSVTSPLRKTVARKCVRDLHLLRSDVVLALTDDYKLCDYNIRGISIIVCSDAEMESSEYGYHGSAYCVGSPTVGEIGAVIMSPSGVFSSKTITEL